MDEQKQRMGWMAELKPKAEKKKEQGKENKTKRKGCPVRSQGFSKNGRERAQGSVVRWRGKKGHNREKWGGGHSKNRYVRMSLLGGGW